MRSAVLSVRISPGEKAHGFVLRLAFLFNRHCFMHSLFNAILFGSKQYSWFKLPSPTVFDYNSCLCDRALVIISAKRMKSSTPQGLMIPQCYTLTSKLPKKAQYSKHPHIRTHNFGGQADWVLIYRVLNDKSASKSS